MFLTVCRMHFQRANSMKTNIRPVIQTSGKWTHLVNTNTQTKTCLFIRITERLFVQTGFGASLDNEPSDQNGYPKNKHLRSAHQQLDKNLGEKYSLYRF